MLTRLAPLTMTPLCCALLVISCGAAHEVAGRSGGKSAEESSAQGREVELVLNAEFTWMPALDEPPEFVVLRLFDGGRHPVMTRAHQVGCDAAGCSLGAGLPDPPAYEFVVRDDIEHFAGYQWTWALKVYSGADVENPHVVPPSAKPLFELSATRQGREVNGSMVFPDDLLGKTIHLAVSSETAGVEGVRDSLKLRFVRAGEGQEN